MYLLYLPILPISTNQLWKFMNKKKARVVKTIKYNNFQNIVQKCICKNENNKIVFSEENPCKIKIICNLTSKREFIRDLDNCLKSLLDTLVLNKILTNDNSKVVKSIKIKCISDKNISYKTFIKIVPILKNGK